MTEKSIERSIWIDASGDRVWQAITEPEEIAQWFLPPFLGAQMKREADGRIFVCMGGMEVPIAHFAVVEPLTQVTVYGLPDNLLATTYTLHAEKGGTQVTVTISGFETLAEEAYQARVGPSSAGWEKALANLKAYIDGAALPFPQGYVAALFGYRREATAKFSVERSIWIEKPRERVWQAITDPQQIQQWYSPGSPWRMSALEVGGTLSVYDAETQADKFTQLIEIVEPLHQFALRSVPEPPETVYEITTYTLTAEKGGTRLTLTNAGYELQEEAIRHQNMEQNAFGFGMMLENLQAYLLGGALPYPYGF